MKDSGLGTPATRADTIETLLKRQYLTRDGKALNATERGIRLIRAVQPPIKSPAMTGEWEARLKRIQRGEADLDGFMAAIGGYVREAVTQAFAVAADRGSPTPVPAAEPSVEPAGPRREPASPDRLLELLQTVFRLPGFRPYQERVCRAVTEGRDALLVMPTGAGKSLCFQLPGIARAGTTLVVSPLIALMEDQVAKLRELGLNAERIHSGRDRATSRQVCVEYLHGRLDYLFIAPERLSVPGFPEMLAKRKPALIAVARRARPLKPAESQLVLQVLEALRWREGQTVRQLHEQASGGQGERRTFEQLLEALAGAGLVEIRDDAFSKDGKVIPFRRLFLTETGRKAGIGEIGVVRLREAAVGAAVRRKRSGGRGR